MIRFCKLHAACSRALLFAVASHGVPTKRKPAKRGGRRVSVDVSDGSRRRQPRQQQKAAAAAAEGSGRDPPLQSAGPTADSPVVWGKVHCLGDVEAVRPAGVVGSPSPPEGPDSGTGQSREGMRQASSEKESGERRERRKEESSERREQRAGTLSVCKVSTPPPLRLREGDDKCPCALREAVDRHALRGEVGGRYHGDKLMEQIGLVLEGRGEGAAGRRCERR